MNALVEKKRIKERKFCRGLGEKKTRDQLRNMAPSWGLWTPIKGLQ